MERLIYLDHAATTPMLPAAIEAMLPFLDVEFANPSGSHRFARRARQRVDEARERIAELAGWAPGGVVFTSGGTEADNALIQGVVRRAGGQAVCPAAEHHAVLASVEAGAHRIVGVLDDGSVDLDQLAAAVGPQTAVVSVMAVNNEVGTVTDLAEVAAVVRARAPHAVVHTDAVQAACWLDLAGLARHVDALSLSAHKFGGPKGVGVLMVRQHVEWAPLLVGGGQERERRSGTHNVAGIVAMEVALAESQRSLVAESARLGALRDRLVDGLAAEAPSMVETVARARKVAGSAHVMFPGIENEAILFLLDEAGLCASAASACASGAMAPSHVLAAMGVPRRLAGGSLRLTLGRTTTEDDIARAVPTIAGAVHRLRPGS
jgi:cysteine desulfurase